MSLFLVEHRHRAESCPANNPDMARGLAGHIHPENAERAGVKVHSDCVIPGEHRLLLVVEADEASQVARFTAPFIDAGSVEIRPVITCETVAQRASDA